MPESHDQNKKKKPFFKRTWVIVVTIIVVLSIARIIYVKNKGVTYQFISVKTGSITETVSVTGNTTPIHSVSLGFQNSGTIAASYYDVGAHVSAGTVIASLDTGDLSASLEQAQANVDAQKAKLDGLTAGSRPEDISASEAAVAKAEQDLTNIYSAAGTTSTTSYSVANDAVRTQLGTIFSNAESSPQLTFQSNDQAAINAVSLRTSASTALNAWSARLSSTDMTSPTALAKLVQDEISYLKTIQSLLAAVSTTLDSSSTTLSTANLATYKANVSTAITEVNTASTNLNAIPQNIASQNLTITQLQAELSLKKAGSTPQDIAAQQAEVEQAQAAVTSAQAKIDNAKIIAPISGVITQQDAKIGQIASPGNPLVTIISNGQFEVDAQVPETDIGKLAVGNVVSMTFDAFPSETFTGKVFYIDPAETITQGVVDYKIKVSFDAPDTRMKSGLTANLDIATKKDDNAMILPQYAVLINDTGTFVETLSASKTVVTIPVTLGIQDENGNVEVLSGVTDGEQVLNIGLKPAGK